MVSSLWRGMVALAEEAITREGATRADHRASLIGARIEARISMSEMRVVGVRVELPANQPILLLRETEGDRYLPIWIGSVEATAIALEQQGVRPPRPLTHDLLKEIITALGRELEQVRITDLQEGTFYAELVFDGDVRVSARPSDSVALALRVGVPIHAEESVLAEAGLIIPDEQEDEVEKFREFLDSVSPEDFRGADT
jgi:uncharacterized protein